MKQLFIFSILFSLITACSNRPTINIDVKPEINFQIFNSYQYPQDVDTSFDANPIMINRIQTAIDSNLVTKGFAKHEFIDQNSADLTIKVSFTKQEKQHDSSFSIGLGTSKMGSNSSSSIGVSIPMNNKANIITTIVIDISDEKQAIWHGSDSYEAKADLSMEQTNQAVSATVKGLLANFPPHKTQE